MSDAKLPDLDPAYLGPDPDLLERQGKASASPIIGKMSEAEQDALRDRIISVRRFSDLSEADQDLLDRACADVDAGGSPTWLPASERLDGDDWLAEDAELDEDDDLEDEVKSIDDDDWVGLL